MKFFFVFVFFLTLSYFNYSMNCVLIFLPLLSLYIIARLGKLSILLSSQNMHITLLNLFRKSLNFFFFHQGYFNIQYTSIIYWLLHHLSEEMFDCDSKLCYSTFNFGNVMKQIFGTPFKNVSFFYLFKTSWFIEMKYDYFFNEYLLYWKDWCYIKSGCCCYC